MDTQPIIKRFRVGERYANVPLDRADDFIRDFPNAVLDRPFPLPAIEGVSDSAVMGMLAGAGIGGGTPSVRQAPANDLGEPVGTALDGAVNVFEAPTETADEAVERIFGRHERAADREFQDIVQRGTTIHSPTVGIFRTPDRIIDSAEAQRNRAMREEFDREREDIIQLGVNRRAAERRANEASSQRITLGVGNESISELQNQNLDRARLERDNQSFHVQIANNLSEVQDEINYLRGDRPTIQSETERRAGMTRRQRIFEDMAMGGLGATSHGTPFLAEHQADLRSHLGIAQHLIDDARQVLERSQSDGGFGAWLSGFGGEAFDPETWTFGIADVIRNTGINRVLNKLDEDGYLREGETLTREEEILLDAFAENLMAHAMLGMDIPRQYMWGETGGHSLAFMASFALNPIARMGAGIPRKVANWGMRKYAAKAGAQGVNVARARAIGNTLNVGSRLPLDVARSFGTATTSQLGWSIADAQERLMDNWFIDVDDDGRAFVAGNAGETSTLEASLKGLGQMMIEGFSEYQGENVLDLFSWIGNRTKFGRGIRASQLGRAVGTYGRNQYVQMVRGVQRRMMHHGIVIEHGEELLETVLNAIFIGDSKISDVWDLDHNVDIFMGILPTTLMFSAARTGGFVRDHSRTMRNLNRFSRQLDQQFVNAADLRSSIQNMGMNERDAMLRETLQDSGLSLQSKEALAGYMSWTSFNEAATSMQQEINQRNAQINAENGGQLYRKSLQEKRVLALEQIHNEKTRLAQQLGELANITDAQMNAMFQSGEVINMTPEQLDMWNEFNQTRAVYEGAVSEMRNEISESIAPQLQILDDVTRDGNVTVVEARIGGSAQPAYVLSGNLALRSDGTINREQSDKTFTVQIAETNEKQIVTLNNILGAETMNTAELKQEIENDVTNQRVDNLVSKFDGNVYYGIGERVTYIDAQGKTQVGQVVNVPLVSVQNDPSASLSDKMVVVQNADGSTATMTSRELSDRVVGETMQIDGVQYGLRDTFTVALNGVPYEASITSIRDGEVELHIPTALDADQRIMYVNGGQLGQMIEQGQEAVEAEQMWQEQTRLEQQQQEQQTVAPQAQTEATTEIETDSRQEFMDSLPKKKNGDIDHSRLTPQQRLQYTEYILGADAALAQAEAAVNKLTNDLSETRARLEASPMDTALIEKIGTLTNELQVYTEYVQQRTETVEQNEPSRAATGEGGVSGDQTAFQQVLNQDESAHSVIAPGKHRLIETSPDKGTEINQQQQIENQEIQSGIQNDFELAQWIADNSSNPSDIAWAYEVAKQHTPEAMLSEWQRDLLRRRVHRNSFEQFGDRNYITQGMVLNWFSRQNETTTQIDAIAQELSELGVEVTPQDIVDFILSYPTKSVPTTNELMRDLNARFSEIARQATGRRFGIETPSGQAFLQSLENAEVQSETAATNEGATNTAQQWVNEIDLPFQADFSSEQSISAARNRIVNDTNAATDREISALQNNKIRAERERNEIRERFAREAQTNLFGAEETQQQGLFDVPVDLSNNNARNATAEQDAIIANANRQIQELEANRQQRIDSALQAFDSQLTLFQATNRGARNTLLQNQFDKLMDWLMRTGLARNVLTNEQAEQILRERGIDALRTMSTTAGEIYGFVTQENDIWIDSNHLNANTLIHEFGHLWNSFVRENNPALYERGRQLVENTTYLERVNNNPAYANLTEAQKIDEALAQAIGDRGESLLNTGNNLSEMTTNRSKYSALRQWLTELWNELANFFGIRNMSVQQVENLTLEQFTSGAVADLLSGERIGAPQQIESVRAQSDIEYANQNDYDFDVSGITENNAAEMQRIKTEAQTDGTFMLAPNGQPTNLNEREWLQVRTQPFIDWFGDWQNDPVNASKVVDENGEPMRVYKGMHGKHTVIKSTMFAESVGYFTDSREFASNFGRWGEPTIIETFLQFNNPLDLRALGNNWSDVSFEEFRNQLPFEISKNIFNKGLLDGNQPMFTFIDSDGFKRLVKERGFDGIIMNENNTNSFIAFESNQIKSATDNNGNFDNTSDDIRFMLANSENNRNFAQNNNNNERGNETRLDNRQTMERSTLSGLVGRQAQGRGISSVIEAAHSAGSPRTVLTFEEREELESRGINPDFDRAQFRRDIEASARENGVWLDQSFLDGYELTHDRKKHGTTENDVYRQPDGKTVIKLNNFALVTGVEAHNNFAAMIDRLNSHNELFPDVPYRIVGFMRNQEGHTSIVLEQPYVQAERNATREEINNYLTERGFEYVVHNEWSNGVYDVADVRPANVLIDANGNLQFIDTIPQSAAYENQSILDERNATGDLRFMAEAPTQTHINRNNTLQDFTSDYNQFLANVANSENLIDEIVREGMTNFQAITERHLATMQTPEELSRVRDMMGDVRALQLNNEQLRYLLWKNANPNDGSVEWKARESQLVHELTPERLFGNRTITPAKMNQLAEKITSYVRENMGNDIVQILSERDFHSLINRLQQAKTERAAVQAINQITTQARIRNNNRILNSFIDGKILNTYALQSLATNEQLSDNITLGVALTELIAGLNAYNNHFQIQGRSKRGVSVQKNVDNETRKIIQYVRDNKNVPLVAANENDVSLEKKQRDIEEKMQSSDYQFSVEDISALTGIEYVRRLNDIAEMKASIQELKDADAADVRALHYGAPKWEVILSEQNQLEQMQSELIRDFTQLFETGRSNLLEWKEGQMQRRQEMLSEALEATNYENVPLQAKKGRGIMTRFIRQVFNDYTGSLDFMLQYVDYSSIMGEGAMYNRFMYGEDGVMTANRNIFIDKTAYKERFDAQTQALFGRNSEWLAKEWRRKSGYTLEFINHEGVAETREMTIEELAYQYALSRQEYSRAQQEMMGYSDKMGEIKNVLGEKNVAMAEWIQDVLLPHEYTFNNQAHITLYGTSMTNTPFYMPVKYTTQDIVGETQVQGDDIGGRSRMSVAPGSWINRRGGGNNLLDLTAGLLSVIDNHVQQNIEARHLERIMQDVNFMLNNKRFRNQLNANEETNHANLTRAFQMALGQYRERRPFILDKTLGDLNKLWAVSRIGLGGHTALKQTMSYPAFLKYSVAPAYVRRLAHNMSPTRWNSNVDWALENMPTFVERWRQGNAGNIRIQFDNTSDVGKIQDMIGRGIMLPNRLVDRFTIVAGARAVYEYGVEKYTAEGASETDARTRALRDAEVMFNQTQQTARPEFKVPVQADRTATARWFSTFFSQQILYLVESNKGLMTAYRGMNPQTRQIMIGNMTAQYVRNGMNEAEANAMATKRVNESIVAGVGKAALYYSLQYGWYFLGETGVRIAAEFLRSALRGGDDNDTEALLEDLQQAHLSAALRGGLGMLPGGQLWLSAYNFASHNRDLNLDVGGRMFMADFAGSLNSMLQEYRRVGTIDNAVLRDAANAIALTMGVNADRVFEIGRGFYRLYEVGIGASTYGSFEATMALREIFTVPRSTRGFLADRFYFNEMMRLEQLYRDGVINRAALRGREEELFFLLNNLRGRGLSEEDLRRTERDIERVMGGMELREARREEREERQEIEREQRRFDRQVNREGWR